MNEPCHSIKRTATTTGTATHGWRHRLGAIGCTLIASWLAAACSGECNITGSSNVPVLDGQMLYLRVSPQGMEQEMVRLSPCLDSCKVVHGRFNFIGEVDSAQMAVVFMHNAPVMPMVVEDAELRVRIENGLQRVSGGPLNDKLYKFIRQRTRIENELWETQQRGMRMLREGKDLDEVRRHIGRRTEKLEREAERLETKFIKENYENVLGPGYFMLLTSAFPAPMLTPQIREILQSAPPTFLADPYVRRYVRQAGWRQ